MNKEIEQSVQDLNLRLDRPVNYLMRDGEGGYGKCAVGHLFADHAACYGGYRLTEVSNHGGGVTGFNTGGTEPRRTCKEFKAYLRGVHDALDVIQLS